METEILSMETCKIHSHMGRVVENQSRISKRNQKGHLMEVREDLK